MLYTIKQYFSFRTDVGFLRFKQEVIGNQYWLCFFYIHIFSIIVCLLAGLTQFSNQLLKEQRNIHKIAGKIYVYNILLINVPACFVLAIFSNGGLIGISGFIVQDLLWAYVTVVAIMAIRKKNIIRHRNYMVLSYAITTTALTFRIIKHLFYEEHLFSYSLFYGLNVWVSLLINLGIAILIIKKRGDLSLKGDIIDQNKEGNSEQ
ncbi:DUF2306 domain-containing protein [Taibaiella sp. KBW10]|uniref:DUF2306 domain-containing protein n=1 Tax=Taibaiella sp. KBW10 TaxID=2153357 RepID=UPI0013151F01|nr:DUF2306 domain-containing protein [Taibaiella sp. KBW10]